MTTKKDNRGKQPRYEGEESTRLSVLLRPRYRLAIEMIARDRKSTLGEAMELAIVNLAKEYSIDGKMLIDYIRPPLESLNRIYDCASLYFQNPEAPKNLLAIQEKHFWYGFHRLESLGSSFRTPVEQYTFEVLSYFMNPYNNFNETSIYLYFDLDKLYATLTTDFHEANDKKQTFEYIYSVSLYMKNLLQQEIYTVPPFEEAKPVLLEIINTLQD